MYPTANTKFRASLAWGLIISGLLNIGLIQFMISFGDDHSPRRLLLPLIVLNGLYFYKKLLDAAWFDATALPLERTVCRWITYLLLAAVLILATIKGYQAVRFYLQ